MMWYLDDWGDPANITDIDYMPLIEAEPIPKQQVPQEAYRPVDGQAGIQMDRQCMSTQTT